MENDSLPRSFRIWTLWTNRAEQTGLILSAADADEALAAASRMGTFCGLGFNRSYEGAFAQEIR